MNDTRTRVIGEVGNPAWEVSKGRNVGQGLRPCMYHFVDLEDGCVRKEEGCVRRKEEGCVRKEEGCVGVREGSCASGREEFVSERRWRK